MDPRLEFLEFPKGFLWGTATSAHQVEGGNHNDWSEWEKSEERIKWLKARGKNPDDFISGPACGSYHRFREDFDLAKKLNNNAHRFSIEWSRIEPEEGKFDEKEIEHYKEVILALRERNLEPFVTLHHFTNPIWFFQKGGWFNRESPEYFSRYVAKVVESFKDLVKFWITINEPVLIVQNFYLLDRWPVIKGGILKSWKVLANLIKAHKESYKVIHEINPDSQVGTAQATAFFDIPIVGFIPSFLRNYYFFNKIRDFQDFIGINYYLRHGLWNNKNAKFSDIGWEIYPEGIYKILMSMRKYRKPIYVTENGLANAKDEKRAQFIVEHLKWIHRAIQEGADVRGYFHWSLLDNFEWGKGFGPRFGLIEMDYKTLERKIRPSAWVYAKICEENILINPESHP